MSGTMKPLPRMTPWRAEGRFCFMCHTKKPFMNLPYGHIVSHLHVTFATYSEIAPG